MVIGSGSLENGYVFQSTTGETLLLEAGCHLSKLEETIDMETANIVGCLISHRHGDHAKHVLKYMGAGIDCYMNQDTIDWFNVDSHHGFVIEPKQQFKLGNFTIKPLDVNHGVPCLAFMIDHPELGRTFFLTDSSYCKYNLSKAKINNWMVECNYLEEKLEENVGLGRIHSKVHDHIIEGHFGLQNCIEFFKANDLSHTINIVLLHKSSKNGCAKTFKAEVGKATGRSVYVAEAGMKFEVFGKVPF